MSTERIVQLQQILVQDPQNTLTRYALAMEYVSAGELESALQAFRALLELDANYVNAYAMAGQALYDAERTTEAADWLQRGIACAARVGNHHAQDKMQTLLDEIAR